MRAGIVALVAFLAALFAGGQLRSSAQTETIDPVYLVEEKPTFHALVFANADYRNIDPIASVRNDGTTLARVFGEMTLQGYRVNGEREGTASAPASFADKTGFFKKLDAYLSAVEPGDVVAFYFSGHGFSADGRHFLVPLDYPDERVHQQRLSQKAVNFQWVLERIQEKRPGLVIALIDSCRTNVPFNLDTNSGVTRGTALPSQLASVEDPTGEGHLEYIVLWSSQQGEPAFGSTDNTRLSDFSFGIAENVGQERAPLDEVVRDIRDATRQLNPALRPVHESNSSAEIYLNPGREQWEAIRERWASVLGTRQSAVKESVNAFLFRFRWSQFGRAALQWLADNEAAPETAAGDSHLIAAVLDKDFDPESSLMTAFVRSDIPIRFPRETGLKAAQQVAALPEQELGIVRGETIEEIDRRASDLIARSGGKRAFDQTILERFNEVVVRFDTTAYLTPQASGPAATELKPNTRLEILETLSVPNKNQLWARIRDPLEDRDVWADIRTQYDRLQAALALGDDAPAPARTVAGRDLDQIYVAERSESIGFLVNRNALEAKLEELRKKRGREIWSVVIATPTVPLPDASASREQVSDFQAQSSLYRGWVDNARLILVENGIRSNTIFVSQGSNDREGSLRIRFRGK